MKKSELTTFIKEEILSTLNESPSSEEIRMAKQAVNRFMKYRNVGQDEAIRDLKNALDVLESSIKEEIKSTLNTEGVWSRGNDVEIQQFIASVDQLKRKFYDVVGSDDVFDGLDAAIRAAQELATMNEATIETSPEDLAKVKQTADKDDVIKVTEEDEDAPAGDSEIEKKASKQDQVINNYKRLQKDLKKHLEMYKDAEGDSAKKAALQMMKKISQSAEYLDAKAKYEKLKQVK